MSNNNNHWLAAPQPVLIKFYAVENFGLKTSIEIHQVVDPTYRTPEYIAYVTETAVLTMLGVP
jgi:hypothetical protein